jgi:hypothetical protein
VFSKDRNPSGSSAGRAAALELGLAGDRRSNRLTMHVNKMHHVTTIARVTKDLGEDEDWCTVAFLNLPASAARPFCSKKFDRSRRTEREMSQMG